LKLLNCCWKPPNPLLLLLLLLSLLLLLLLEDASSPAPAVLLSCCCCCCLSASAAAAVEAWGACRHNAKVRGATTINGIAGLIKHQGGVQHLPCPVHVICDLRRQPHSPYIKPL
jgi:hypothetical protein